jgi:hypothetical protein
VSTEQELEQFGELLAALLERWWRAQQIHQADQESAVDDGARR